MDESATQDRAEANSNGAARTGLMERLRRKRERIGGERYLDLDVPGYDGDLFIKFHVLEGGWDEMKKIGERVDRSHNPRAEINAAADVIVRCCDGLFVRQESGVIEPLDGGEDPPTFSDVGRIEAFFDLQPLVRGERTPRQCVFQVFNNDMAVQRVYIQLGNWIEDASSADDEDFLGESVGATR